MTAVEVFAPAKINLTLHVTGRRDDGYHELDSLVVFAGIGDVIRVEPAEALCLRLDGPFAQGLEADRENLVWRAARLLSPDLGARISLTKNLPVASGIGGGSADAAAALRALAVLWNLPDPSDDPAAFAQLGADIPVCLRGEPVRMSGIGERLSPVPTLPEAHFVLANPLKPLATADVFRALADEDVDGLPMPDLPIWTSLAELAEFMWEDGRNDLAGPAQALMPEIADIVAALAATVDWRVSGMSGSGATCFALYDDREAARAAAAAVKSRHPEWWVKDAPLLKSAASAKPQLIRATT